MKRVRKGVMIGNYALTTTESPLLLTAELEMTDSDGAAFGSTKRAEDADGLPCDSIDNDDTSKGCGAWPGSGSDSVIDSASCGASGRGDIDKKDAELVSDRASEVRTSSALDSRESVLGDCWRCGVGCGSRTKARGIRDVFAARERDWSSVVNASTSISVKMCLLSNGM